MDISDIIVIGAGISGCATAYALAEAGHSVTLLDRFGPAAMGSGWTLAGVRQSGRHPAELGLAQEAVKMWETLDAELGAPTHYIRRGNLRLARDEAEYAQIRTMVDAQCAAGLDLHFLPDNAALRAIAPAISPDIPGASFCPGDGHADPIATIDAYIGALTRMGVTLRMGEAVTAIETDAGRVIGVRTDRGRIGAARVVLAGGAPGNDLLAPLGIAVPLALRVVTVIRSAPMAPVLDQVIGVAGGDWAGRQESSGRLRITSGSRPSPAAMEIVATPRGPRPVIRPQMSALRDIIAGLDRVLPGMSGATVEEVWAGLIDLTPDALPVLDTAPGIEGLAIGTGFSGHGFCLGPVTGRILADLALGRTPSHDLAAFRLARFAGAGADAGAPVAEPTLHG